MAEKTAKAPKAKTATKAKAATAKPKKTAKATAVKKQDDSYAIFQTGGKQYQAVVGRTVAIEKLEGEVGDKVSFDQVLLSRKADGSVDVGTPFLKNGIKASIVRQMKEPKIIIFRFKRRKKVRVKNGHRQPKTVVRIEAI